MDKDIKNKDKAKEIKLIIPEELKNALMERSKQDFRSMNSEAIYLLSKALGLE